MKLTPINLSIIIVTISITLYVTEASNSKYFLQHPDQPMVKRGRWCGTSLTKIIKTVCDNCYHDKIVYDESKKLLFPLELS